MKSLVRLSTLVLAVLMSTLLAAPPASADNTVTLSVTAPSSFGWFQQIGLRRDAAQADCAEGRSAPAISRVDFRDPKTNKLLARARHFKWVPDLTAGFPRNANYSYNNLDSLPWLVHCKLITEVSLPAKAKYRATYFWGNGKEAKTFTVTRAYLRGHNWQLKRTMTQLGG